MTITKKRFEREYIGYAGLLVWIGMDGNYHAADLCCPHCIKNSKPVEVDGLYAICPICNEQFDLSFGFAIPTKGITDEPLRRYQTRLDNSFTGLTLRIFN
jgi:nitrite reductase/ring-hydroxylating ferredoxin subunit